MKIFSIAAILLLTSCTLSLGHVSGYNKAPQDEPLQTAKS